MKITATKSLVALRRAAYVQIDTEAGNVRRNFITIAPGQDSVYQEKRLEADKVVANPAIAATEVPHIAAEAQMNGVQNLTQAANIIVRSKAWAKISSMIEIKRLAAKKAVAAATTPSAIDQATVIDYSDVLAYVDPDKQSQV